MNMDNIEQKAFTGEKRLKEAFIWLESFRDSIHRKGSGDFVLNINGTPHNFFSHEALNKGKLRFVEMFFKSEPEVIKLELKNLR